MSPPSGLVTLLTDFGHTDPYVGTMKGMIKRAFVGADIVDLCHEVRPQDLGMAAIFWGAAAGRFPAGTVHVAVVDPGVGTDRDLVAAVAWDCIWVAPDNGLLTVLSDVASVRRVDTSRHGLHAESATFHGRDLFAPLAGKLAAGALGFDAVGPVVPWEALQVLPPGGPHGRVIFADRFGNLVTDWTRDEVAAASARRIGVGSHQIPFRRTYAEAAPGEAVALINSYDLLEIAINQGDAAETLGVAPGAKVELQT